MKIILIASVSENGFIGINNEMMWNLPNDLNHFKILTWGNPILMGRKTFESIGKILPGRKNIVLTKNKKYRYYNNLSIIHSINEINNFSYSKLFIIGGETVYKIMISKADIIELTIVHHNFNGNKKFPKIDFKIWKIMNKKFNTKDINNSFDHSFIKLIKRNN